MPTLHYPKLLYARRTDPQTPLTVAINQPTGFSCAGTRCKQRPIHSSHYYNPRYQPNKALIGLSCPFDPNPKENKGSIRTYKRLEFLQDICTLNNQQIDLVQPLTGPQATFPERPNKRQSTDTMPDAKRSRVACAGIPGVGPHLGKYKTANRQCTWECCPECCRAQRIATGTKCYTHENGERAKKPPTLQPFLQTVRDTAEGSGLTQEEDILNDVTGSDLGGSAPPVQPLQFSPSAVRTYHLNQTRDEEAKREAEAAEASCDRNISISLWLKEESDPLSFLFAPKSMKQYCISECEAMMLFLNATETQWNKCLWVYDVKGDRWNVTLVGTPIPMLTPIREALVCLMSVEPKSCYRMIELQSRLTPSATNMKGLIDSLRATPRTVAPTTCVPASAVSSSQSSVDTPSPSAPTTLATRKVKGGSFSSQLDLTSSFPAQPYINVSKDDDYDPVEKERRERGPKFSHNIFNDPNTSSDHSPASSIIFLNAVDEGTLEAGTFNTPRGQINSSNNSPGSSIVFLTGVNEGTTDAGALDIGVRSSLHTPKDTKGVLEESKPKTRRTWKTGLWPPSDMPMQRLIEWHSAHTTGKGKKEVWERFFAPDYTFNKLAMFRYIRWINQMRTEEWEEWFKQCERDQIEPTFETAKSRKHFGTQLDEVW
ncbi:hypothetical protein DFH28DRAFT_905954 [Melampsora americana]|nr:hypothetical protein DFH28DRAFT_905954 [Melampsora americana]